MGVHDRHHVRSCFVDFAVKETLLILIVPWTADRFAVQVVLDNVRGRHNSRRDVTGNIEPIRIRAAPNTDVSKRIQNTQLLGGQHAIGKHEIVDQRFLGWSWWCLGDREESNKCK